METTLLLLLAALLLFTNAFFVLAEFAAVSTRPTQVDAFESRGEPRAKALRHVVTHLDEYLSVCQVGITFASVGLGFVGELAFARIFTPMFGSAVAGHSVAITVSYLLVSFLHIVIGELVPKSIAIRTGARSALRVARTLRFFHRIFFVPLWFLNGVSNAILRLLPLPKRRDDRLPSEDEIRIILARSQKQGQISFRRLLLLENVFDFGNVRVRDAMVPLEQVAMLRVDSPWNENRAVLERTKRSRYPVVEGTPPRPVGILHVKDLLYSRQNLDEAVDLRPLLRKARTTDPNALIEDLLAELQRRRGQIVLVDHPKHGFSGIITMEDIIEEIVGVIEDEFETEPVLRFADATNERRFVLDLRARDLTDAIAEVVDRVPASELPAPRDEIVHAVLERERVMSTYLGRGLAVPHARLDGLAAPCLLIARSTAGIRMGDAADDTARVLFVLLTSVQQPRDQLRLLAAIARLRESDSIWARLLAAKTPAEVMEAIASAGVVLG